MGSTICTAGFPSPAIASSCFTARCASIWYGFFIATLLFSAKENCSQPIKRPRAGSRYFLRSTGHSLVLRLLNQDQFAELIGLVCLALADHLSVRLKYAEQFSVGLSVATQHPFPCLAQHLLDSGNYFIQLFLGLVQYRQIAPLDAPGDLARKLLSLTGNPAGDFQQFDVGLLHLLPALLRLVPAGARNRQNLQLGGPTAVAHLRASLARHGGDFLHDPRQHAHAVTQ